MSSENKRKAIGRRDFVKGTVAGAGALALAGLGTQNVSAQSGEIEWDMETDVIVVGYGGAGAAAAIAAYDAGAAVLILEKTDAGGGSTYYSGGYFVSPDDPEAAISYLMRCAKAGGEAYFEVDEELLTIWAEEAAESDDWIRSLGAECSATLKGWYDFDGADGYTSYQVEGDDRSGVALWNVLAAGVEERGIEVLFNTPAIKLLTYGVLVEKGEGDSAPMEKEIDREVVGVLAKMEGRQVAIKARKAVILTCGGFDYNEVFKKNYLPAYPAYSVGHPGNTGDAITMAADVDADLWHLNAISGNVCHKLERVPVAFPSMLQLGAAGKGVIFVDKYGRRFVNETLPYDGVQKALMNFDSMKQEFVSLPCWCIFDEATRVQGPVALSVPIGNPIYTWSADNSDEIAEGAIIAAETLAELAELIGIDPDALQASVDAWNQSLEDGSDPFGRTMGAAIGEGPYYALQAYPGIWGTAGGPRINGRAQVLNVSGAPIAHLYAAGNASGLAFPFLYPLSGTAIGDALAMGRIAGRNAAAEEETGPAG